MITLKEHNIKPYEELCRMLETQDKVALIVKGKLISQKPEISTVTGNTINDNLEQIDTLKNFCVERIPLGRVQFTDPDLQNPIFLVREYRDSTPYRPCMTI